MSDLIIKDAEFKEAEKYIERYIIECQDAIKMFKTSMELARTVVFLESAITDYMDEKIKQLTTLSELLNNDGLRFSESNYGTQVKTYLNEIDENDKDIY